ncbi:MAG: hypothetical protein OXG23_10930, partial [Chloroflexi bacterium]|nr:hypothetical protein [Chloroflexota bacterium]
MTRRLSKASFARLAVVLFALAPALLFAYLGQFMRMMRDDYSRIAHALESGPISHIIHHRNSWGGSFGNIFVQGVLGRADGLTAQLILALIIALWPVG